jgi:hypothetical protein
MPCECLTLRTKVIMPRNVLVRAIRTVWQTRLTTRTLYHFFILLQSRPLRCQSERLVLPSLVLWQEVS